MITLTYDSYLVNELLNFDHIKRPIALTSDHIKRLSLYLFFFRSLDVSVLHPVRDDAEESKPAVKLLSLYGLIQKS